VKGVYNFVVSFCGKLVFAIVFLACQPPDKKPAGILTHEEMVKVMAEIYINEEKVSRLGLSADSAVQLFQLMKVSIFETTGVPDSVFKKSLDYYMDRPMETDRIYSVLIDSLQLREQRTEYRPDQQ
jgi:hypothetical protein